MPGEERKFKRRRIVAFLPFCKRECEEAVSHAEATGAAAPGVEVGVSAVGVEDGGGVAAASGTLVTVGEARGACVDTAVLVSVGRGSGVTVSPDGSAVVGESKGVGVDTIELVEVIEEGGAGVEGSEVDVDEAETVAGVSSLESVGAALALPAITVPEVELTKMTDVAGVDSGAGVWGTAFLFRKKKTINKRVATISLKRS